MLIRMFKRQNGYILINKVRYSFILLTLAVPVSLFAANPQPASQAEELHSINQSLQASNQSTNSTPKKNLDAKYITSGAKHHKPLSAQQINAKGQDALNGTTYQKQQLEREKLKIQSEKYQAEIAKHRPASNPGLEQNQVNQMKQLQQSPQQDALEKTKTMMPAPSFLEQESNQNQAEIKAGEKNQMLFYNANDNQ